MHLIVHLTLCLFLVITDFENTLSMPRLRSRDSAIVSPSRGTLIHRVRRQGPIVQPSWSLNSDVSLFEDYNVRVTDEKLDETEAIRDLIQGTVDNGTYVVELDEEDFEEEEGNTGEEVPSEELSQPGPELEVQVNPPAPKPNPPPSPTQPEPAPKPKPANEPKPAAKPSNLFSRFRITPRRNSGSPFFTWLRKSFIVN